MQVITRIYAGQKADVRNVGEILKPYVTTDLAMLCGTTREAALLETIQLSSLNNGADIRVEVHLYPEWLHPDPPSNNLIVRIDEFLTSKIRVSIKLLTASLLIEEHAPTILKRVR